MDVRVDANGCNCKLSAQEQFSTMFSSRVHGGGGFMHQHWCNYIDASKCFLTAVRVFESNVVSATDASNSNQHTKELAFLHPSFVVLLRRPISSNMETASNQEIVGLYRFCWRSQLHDWEDSKVQHNVNAQFRIHVNHYCCQLPGRPIFSKEGHISLVRTLIDIYRGGWQLSTKQTTLGKKWVSNWAMDMKFGHRQWRMQASWNAAWSILPAES